MRIVSTSQRDRLALVFGLLAFASISLGIGLGYLSPPRVAWIFPTAGFVGYVWSSAKCMRFWSGFRGTPKANRFPRRDLHRSSNIVDWERAPRRVASGRPVRGH